MSYEIIPCLYNHVIKVVLDKQSIAHSNFYCLVAQPKLHELDSKKRNGQYMYIVSNRNLIITHTCLFQVDLL